MMERKKLKRFNKFVVLDNVHSIKFTLFFKKINAEIGNLMNLKPNVAEKTILSENNFIN
jgi:hypothetical protein